MSGKNQFIKIFNFQSTSPVIGFLPITNLTGSVPSGNPDGAMASTNTIYSDIIDTSKMDDIGIEYAWSGTPTGTFSVWASNSGINFTQLVFSPVLAQPAGGAGSGLVSLMLFPFKYLFLQYANSSGSGTLTAYGQFKDLN
jgi:hypothetical protein